MKKLKILMNMVLMLLLIIMFQNVQAETVKLEIKNTTYTLADENRTVIENPETYVTNQNIIVKIELNKEVTEISGWTLSEDKKSISKVYKDNIEEKITITDLEGNKVRQTIKISKIDKTTPVIYGIANKGKYSHSVTPTIEDESLKETILYNSSNEKIEWQSGQEIKDGGTYKIRATDNAGNQAEKEFTITGSGNIEMTFKENTYKISNEYIISVPEETTIETFLSNINLPENSQTTLVNEKGEEASENKINNKNGKETSNVFTGLSLIVKTSENIYNTYTIIIAGDLNGSSNVDLSDLSGMAQIILESVNSDSLAFGYKMAADLNEDNTVNIVDLARLVSKILATD